jgi:tRNA-modifying protein YgfZ
MSSLSVEPRSRAKIERGAETLRSGLMPGLDAHLLKTYGRTLEAFGLFDLSKHGLLSCTGKDAGQFLHNLCTNEVLKLPVGRSSETFFTTAQAKIVDHVWILNRGGSEPTFYIDVGENQGPRILAHLDRFLISEQLELFDLTEALAHFHLAGPHSMGLLAKVCGQKIESLQTLEATEFTINDRQILVWRRNRLGMIGFDLLWKPGDTAVWLNDLACQPVEAGADQVFDCLRIEAGLPKFGVDMTEANLPQEVGRIDQTISYTKGCYIGQETVARVRSFGHVNRTLRGLVLSESSGTESGVKLFHDGAEVGAIASCARSPRLKKTIALGYLRRGHDAAGAALSLGSAASAETATVADLPFVEFVEARQ